MNQNTASDLMAKWADYLISAVRYNSDHTRTVQARQTKDTGDRVPAGEIVSRATVIENIHDNKTYVTIIKMRTLWEGGEGVGIVHVRGQFMRTGANETEEDNLGELPEFLDYISRLAPFKFRRRFLHELPNMHW